MLKVASVQKATNAQCIIDVNPYVPISFRTRSQPIAGARHILLGDFKSQLLEFQFPPESLALSGFTLVSGKTAAQGGLSGDGPSVTGLPIISLPDDESFSVRDKIPRIDLVADVVLSFSGARAEIRLGSAEAFNRSIIHGRVKFLLYDDALVGLWLLELTEKEQRTLHDYIAVQLNQRV
jgi:hypothetical protein